MKGFVKWGLAAAGLLVVLIIGAMVIIPMVVDVKQYKPQIEQLVLEKTGRQFSMGDDMDVSVFPWIGVKLSDLRLGSPEGFKARDMVRVKGFEVRLKVMPLLSKRVEVSTFVVDSPQIFLEKAKNGRGNWEGLGQSEKIPATENKVDKTDQPTSSKEAMSISGLMVDRFSIINGLVQFFDQGAGLEKRLSDLNLNLENISLDKPIGIHLTANADGKPLSIEGRAGPLGNQPGKDDIALDIAVKALDILACSIKGKLMDPSASSKFDFTLDLDTFSPRKLMDALGMPFPVETSDPTVLDKVSLKTRLQGSPSAIKLSDGFLVLDDSTLKFKAGVKAFSKPEFMADLDLDKIDVDRYLPPASKQGQGKEEKTTGSAPASAKAGKAAKPDYSGLRKMVVDAGIKIGSLKAAKLNIEKFKARVKGKKGVFDLDPLSFDLYQGSVAAKAGLDVRKDNPAARFKLNADKIQAASLLKAGAGMDLIEGVLKAEMDLTMTGDTPDMIKKTVKGKGELKFLDGAIVGVDLAGMVRNALLKSENTGKEKPRTDFSELAIPFSLGQGVANILDATMKSPLLRVLVRGKAHLIKETLDIRVEPKFVATLKGQGDTQDRSGLMVPVKITGTFSQPKIRPDLEGMLKNKVPDPKDLEKLIKDKIDSGKEIKSVEKKAKGMLQDLVPGFKLQ